MNTRTLIAGVLGVLSIVLPASAQHVDVLVQAVDGKLVTGAANYDNNTWLVGQRVFKRQFLSNFRTPDPGFTGLETGNPLLEPGVLGLTPGIDLYFDIVPTTIDDQSANFWWWDGVDLDDDGYTQDDVLFGNAPEGVTWNAFDENFDLFTADGSDTVVPGGLVQRTFSDGATHNHLALQVANSGSTPPSGVYLSAMVLRAEGFEPSEPFFFVHRTSDLTNTPRDLAADWVNANYDALVAEPLPGDFNGDGFVDAADYTVWRDGLGGDYDIWRDNYGAVSAIPPAASSLAVSVPEPGSLFLLAALISAVATKHR